uniref:Calcineurin-like phosphoesterase domain-containing protein n=1 Tax=Plectus sambesii TaxID=2011161 RepID=A0A914WHS7_9BILA
MPSPTCKAYCLLWICVFAVTYVVGGIAVTSASGHAKGNTTRVVIVLKAELIMLLMSVFIYKRIMALFEPQGNVKPDEDNKLAIAAIEMRLAPYRKIASIATIVWLTLSHLMYFLYYFPDWAQHALFLLSATSLGVWTYLIALLFGFSLVNLATRVVQMSALGTRLIKPLLDIPLIKNLTLNSRLQTQIALFATLFFSLLTFYSCDKVTVKQLSLHLKDTPAQAKGMRLGLISDLHVGGTVGAAEINMVVELANEQQLDAIFIVGDLVDGTVSSLSSMVSPIQHLKAKHGVFFVTGNHEYYYGDANDWTQLLPKYGVKVLQNANHDLNGVCLVGLDDISAEKSGTANHAMDASKAIKGCTPDRPIIALAHNPVSAFNISKITEPRPVDLILSGHTHAGQFYVVAPVVYMLLPFLHGMYNLPNGGRMLVSAGTLYQGPPMKMAGYSELWVITLQ